MCLPSFIRAHSNFSTPQANSGQELTETDPGDRDSRNKDNPSLRLGSPSSPFHLDHSADGAYLEPGLLGPDSDRWGQSSPLGPVLYRIGQSEGEAGACAQEHTAGGPQGGQQRADQPGIFIDAECAVAERRYPVDRAAPLPQPPHPPLAQLLPCAHVRHQSRTGLHEITSIHIEEV